MFEPVKLLESLCSKLKGKFSAERIAGRKFYTCVVRRVELGEDEWREIADTMNKIVSVLRETGETAEFSVTSGRLIRIPGIDMTGASEWSIIGTKDGVSIFFRKIVEGHSGVYEETKFLPGLGHVQGFASYDETVGRVAIPAEELSPQKILDGIALAKGKLVEAKYEKEWRFS